MREATVRGAWLCVLFSTALDAGCASGHRAPSVPPGPANAEPFIMVLGQVNRPASVPSSAPRPLCELVALCGGPTSLACRRIVVDRMVANGRQRWALSVDDLRDGDGCRLTIWPGDSVLVGSCGD